MICKHPSGREILRVSRLGVAVREKGKERVLLRDVDFFLDQGEIHGIVGESGSGKSLFARTLVRLEFPARIVTGSILIDSCNVAEKSPQNCRFFRGKKVSLALQDPTSAMDPVFTLASQFKDALSILPRPERSMGQVYQLLETVGISSPESRCRQYPHEWSRGMLQRAQLVMALLSSPEILILDEVTSAWIPPRAADHRAHPPAETDTPNHIVLITHDLAMAAHLCDRISVMHRGTIVETRPVDSLFKQPKHPYTKELVSSTGVSGGNPCLDR